MAIGATTSPTITRRQRYDRLRTSLFNIRSDGFDAHYAELGEHFMPRRPRFTTSDRNRGDKRSKKIIDSSPRIAARTLQSGMHAGLTSPARPWMKLTTPDPSLAEKPGVSQWLHLVTQRMLTVFQISNIYNALPVLYGDLGVFGTAAIGIMDDPQDFFRAYVYPVGSYAFSVDTRGLPNAFVREYELSVAQIVGEFGFPDGPAPQPKLDNMSLIVRQAWAEKQTEQNVKVAWMIVENDQISPRKPWPWLSIWFEIGAEGVVDIQTDRDGLLREQGFFEFPVMIPRWDVTGEDTYGTDCPGMTALGDAKQLQNETKKKAQALEKMLNPPLQAPPSARTTKVSLLPGDISYHDAREQSQGIRPIHETRFSVREVVEDIREVQFRISRVFYEDLFLMMASSDQQRGRQPVTAREVDERHEEKLLALGPVLERTNDELLNPFVDRVFAMMLRAGLIPPAPPDLEGVKLRVEYISLMAQAQRLVTVVSTDRFMASVIGLMEAFPEVRHKVKPLQAVDDYAQQIGVNPSLIRSDEEADELARQEAEAVQNAQRAQEAAVAGAAAKDLAAAKLTDDSALSRLVGSQPATT